jgi:hypothetical protein
VASVPARLLALHGLRLKGFASAVALSEVVGVDRSVLDEQLTALLDEHLVRHRDGSPSGYSLTATGRTEHKRLVAEELERAGARAAVEDGYRRFLAENEEFLELCTAWQVREVDGASTLNDHSDAAYDEDIVGRLVALDHRVRPVCADLGIALGRFAQYELRLARAREQVQAGEREWIAAPMLPSYHTVWFELHEDLLVTLGRERSPSS